MTPRSPHPHPHPVTLQLGSEVHRPSHLYFDPDTRFELKAAWSVVLFLLQRKHDADAGLSPAMRGWMDPVTLLAEYAVVANVITLRTMKKYAVTAMNTLQVPTETGPTETNPAETSGAEADETPIRRIIERSSLGYRLVQPIQIVASTHTPKATSAGSAKPEKPTEERAGDSADDPAEDSAGADPDDPAPPDVRNVPGESPIWVTSV